jgi:hypothetical protein
MGYYLYHAAPENLDWFACLRVAHTLLVAAGTEPSQPKRHAVLGSAKTTLCALDSSTPCSASIPKGTFRGHSSEVGAVCIKVHVPICAGGRSATAVRVNSDYIGAGLPSRAILDHLSAIQNDVRHAMPALAPNRPSLKREFSAGDRRVAFARHADAYPSAGGRIGRQKPCQRRRLSAAARKRIAAAQRKRWAAVRNQQRSSGHDW